MQITAFSLAQRWVGVKETPGPAATPFVLGMLRLDGMAIADDATAWCSAFINFIAWLLRLPRSKSLAARSWLWIGETIALEHARVGFDVVVLKRGLGPQPGPDVRSVDASGRVLGYPPGHVGLFAGLDGEFVLVLGGNQGDAVSIDRFPRTQVLGVRRLLSEVPA